MAAQQTANSFRTLRFIMQNAPKMTVPQAVKYLIAETVEVPNIPRKPWVKGQHKDAIIALIGPHGIAKCLSRNTPIIMHDGTVKPVQDVITGDLVMGPDSKPRTVTGVSTGQEELVRITPKKGDSFTCNMSHIICLKACSGCPEHEYGDIIDISVRDYIAKGKYFKQRTSLFHSEAIDFGQNRPLPIDPYILGVWLGDGSSDAPQFTINENDKAVSDTVIEYLESRGLEASTNNRGGANYIYGSAVNVKGKFNKNEFTRDLRAMNLINNKHIPQVYLTSTLDNRRQLLAGLIDTDGSLSNSNCLTIIQKSKVLSDNILFLARSLGISAYQKEFIGSCVHKGEVREGTYYKITMSGDLTQIPSKVQHKCAAPSKQEKDVLRVGIKSIELLGVGDYYGFTLDGDGRFLLGDFLVTHNTSLLKSVTHQNNLDFCRLEFAGTESEDNLPIATQQEDPNKPGQYKKLSFGKLYSKPEGKIGRGICLISEGLGADRKQQQQMRAFISERELAGVHISDGWTFVLDSNFGNEYTDVQQLTRSLEARMFVIPVQGNFEDTLKYWSGYNTIDEVRIPEDGIGAEVPVTPQGFYEPLYTFLRMWGNDSKNNAFEAADPRRWTELADSLARQHSCGFIDDAERQAFFGLMVGDKLAGLWAQMLQWGNDPKFFPIHAHKLIKADKAEHAKHMDLIKYWKDARNDKTFLLACTIMELCGYLEANFRDNSGSSISKTEVKNICDLVTNVDAPQVQLLISHSPKSIQNAIFDAIKDLPIAYEIVQFTKKQDGSRSKK